MKKYIIAVGDKYIGTAGRIRLVDDMENARIYSTKHHAALSLARKKPYCWPEDTLDEAKILELECRLV